MKHTCIHLAFTAVLAVIVTAALSSCYTPNPLYGKWMDNDGNSITFQAEGEFSAKIATTVDSEGNSTPKNYSGTYTVIDNVIIFSYESLVSENTTVTKNTTWDLSGAILYLTWYEDESSKALVLYHVSR